MIKINNHIGIVYVIDLKRGERNARGLCRCAVGGFQHAVRSLGLVDMFIIKEE